MVPLTTCQAMQYAVKPETSQEFERLSKKFPLIETTELDASRTLFYGGLFTIILGGAGMITDPRKYASLVAIGAIETGIGSMCLYTAAKRVQGLWELNRTLALIDRNEG